MKKRIMPLLAGMLLLLTACGQTGSNSASTMLPVAAVQSAAQAIAPMEDKMQEDVDSLPAEEGVEEAKGADDKETSNPAEDTDTPSAKTEETSTTPAGEGQSDAPEPPAAPKQPVTPEPEDKPTPHPHRHLHRSRQRNRRKIRAYARTYARAEARIGRPLGGC